uniref:Uncharacterized protein n=1 Tax=Romanomermis culicivorax TaxID=13658 RepID=A0A915JZC0_ROMCU
MNKDGVYFGRKCDFFKINNKLNVHLETYRQSSLQMFIEEVSSINHIINIRTNNRRDDCLNISKSLFNLLFI